MNKESIKALQYIYEKGDVIDIFGDLSDPKIPVQEFLDLKERGLIDAVVTIPVNKENPIRLYEVRITSLGRDCLEQGDEKVVNISVGSITSEQVQLGNGNTMDITINVSELVDQIAQSDNEEAKSLMKSLLENKLVGSVLGAGVSRLISLI